MKVTVFGDSILKGVITTPQTKGIFDITENNSLSLAQKALGFELDNRSIYGNIICKAQVKFNKWIEKGESADICIIEFGGNDCDYDWSPVSQNPNAEYPQKTPLEDYIKFYDQMVTVCRNHKILPVTMTLPALVSERWFKTITKGQNEENILKFLGGQIDRPYTNQEIYNTHLVNYAHKNNLDIVDMRLLLLETGNFRDYMCMDGIHPNEKGYALMSKLWIEKLPELFEKAKGLK